MLKRSETEVATIKIADLKISREYQMRASACEATIDEYRQAIEASEVEWPFNTPCSVYRVDGELILVDGHHRVAAMEQAGRETIHATVIDGSKSDALIAALSANHKHGLRRTNADKRRAITVALSDDLLKTMSDREIAGICGVHHQLVGTVRVHVDESSTWTIETRTGADGKSYPADRTSNRKMIAAAVAANDGESDTKLAKQIGCNRKTVASVRRHIGDDRPATNVEADPESDRITVPQQPVDPCDAIAAIWDATPEHQREKVRNRIAELADLGVPDVWATRIVNPAATARLCEIPQDFFRGLSDGDYGTFDNETWDEIQIKHKKNIEVQYKFLASWAAARWACKRPAVDQKLMYGITTDDIYNRRLSVSEEWESAENDIGRHIAYLPTDARMEWFDAAIEKRRSGVTWTEIRQPLVQVQSRIGDYGRTWSPIWINIDDIQTNPDADYRNRTRMSLSPHRIDEYVEIIECDADDWGLAPLEVFWTDRMQLLLVDGFHRFAAARAAGVGRVLTHVTYGSIDQYAEATMVAHNVKRQRTTS